MAAAFSVFPLIAGIAAAAMALAAAWVPHGRRRAVLWFIALNVCAALWSLGSFVQLHWAAFPDPALVPPEPLSLGYLHLWVYALGLAGTSAYWPLFAGSFAESRFWTSRTGIATAHLPGAFTIAAAVTNPWHHLFIRLSPEGVVGGPLAAIHYLTTMVAAGVGIWLVVRGSLASATGTGGRQAVRLAIAAGLPLAGAVALMIARLSGNPLPFNPIPVLFAVLNVVLAYEVVFRDFVGIMPLATFSTVVSHSAVPIAYLDGGLRIVAASPGLARILGGTERDLVGTDVLERFPDLPHRELLEEARRTRGPVEFHTDVALFPAADTMHARAWSWSLAPVNEPGRPEGFILSLAPMPDSAHMGELERMIESIEAVRDSAEDIGATLSRTVTRTVRVLGCDTSCVVIGDATDSAVLRLAGEPNGTWEPFRKSCLPHLAIVLASGQPFVSSDAEADDRQEARALLDLGLKATLCVPLVHGGEPRGALSFDSTRPVAFGAAHLRFARRLASAMSRHAWPERLDESA